MESPFDALQQQLNRIESLLVQLLKRESTLATEAEKPISIKRVAELLQISVGAVYQIKEIPRYKRNNRILFFETEILDYIRNGPKIESAGGLFTDRLYQRHMGMGQNDNPHPNSDAPVGWLYPSIGRSFG